ncbi:MAG: peptide deformylase [Gammaproteobacteria bacterium]|nr:peptide deformylase [Gammaproteobacteria bacterium]
MAVRRIIRMGHPALRTVASELDRKTLRSDAIRRLVDDMVDTLHDYSGIGLAAPQVNESVRLAIVEIPAGPTRYGEIDPMPLEVYVNPRISVIEADCRGFWEGCLSIPGLRGYVERPQHVRVDFQDLEGHRHSVELRGFTATVFQHEFDHLDGKLYVDRVEDTKLLMFEEEFARYHAEEETLD